MGETIGPWQYREGVLFFKNRLYILANSKLIPDIIGQFHSSAHEGHQKTLQRIRANFYWKGVKQQIAQFIRNCDVCQRNKSLNLTPAGLLQPLPVPTKVWSDISMDFIEGLPPSHGKTTIFVVVDRLSKFAYFITIAHPYTTVTIAQVFF